MNLLIKYPSRERPIQFFSVLNKAQQHRVLKETRFLVTLDSNDAQMNNEKTKQVLNRWGNLEYIFGESKSKIDAVNRDMESSGEWDIVLLLSDDMHPQIKGYDKIIVELFEKHFPDTDGILWLNDGYTRERINTIVCAGRKYLERISKEVYKLAEIVLYHPSYFSLFADNEHTEIAQMTNKFIYHDQVLIQHRHPMTVRGVMMDGLYKRNDKFFAQDKKNYENRKAQHFNLMEIC